MTLENKIFYGLVTMVVIIIVFLLTPGSLYLRLNAQPPNNQEAITAKVGEDVTFELCRSGIILPTETRQIRTTTSLDNPTLASEYDFEPTIEDSGCRQFTHFAFDPNTGEPRIPQEAGKYEVTTNVFFPVLFTQKNTSYKFEFEYVE